MITRTITLSSKHWQLIFDAADTYLDAGCPGEAWQTPELSAAAADLADALAQPEPQGPTDEDWDALKDRLWGKYETIGYQGERFMYEGNFCTALDLARQELTRWGRPAIEPVPIAERLPWPQQGE